MIQPNCECWEWMGLLLFYQWERFGEQGRPLQEPASQQQNEEALPPIPEPRSPDEASLLLAQMPTALSK